MSEQTFVDRAVHQAQHSAWREQGRTQYTPEPETWHRPGAGTVDALQARVRELEETVARLQADAALNEAQRTQLEIDVTMWQHQADLERAAHTQTRDMLAMRAAQVGKFPVRA
jgi:hypothetical protein